MTGKYLADLMNDKWLKGALAKHARRYSKRGENQEEYIQDAWLRISEHPEGESMKYYAEEGRKAIVSSYWRRYRSVSRNDTANANGISITGKDEKPLPKRAINVYRNKYLDPKHTTLDWQYYEDQEEKMKEDASFQIGWYNQCEGFDSLDKGEQEKIIHRFMRSGYQVGMPVGATPGKKVRYYDMYYTIDNNGVVEKGRAPLKIKLENKWPEPGIGGTDDADLGSWYKLREFGGSPEWMKKLNNMISEIEGYFTHE